MNTITIVTILNLTQCPVIPASVQMCPVQQIPEIVQVGPFTLDTGRQMCLINE